MIYDHISITTIVDQTQSCELSLYVNLCCNASMCVNHDNVIFKYECFDMNQTHCMHQDSRNSS